METEISIDEAISYLEEDIDKLWDTKWCNYHKQALKMGIDALKEKKVRNKKDEICNNTGKQRRLSCCV